MTDPLRTAAQAVIDAYGDRWALLQAINALRAVLALPVEAKSDIEQLAQEAMRVAREYGLMRATDEEVETAIDNLACAAYRTTQPAATPAGQAQPVASVEGGKWDGAEYWMPLAWALCAEENGEDSCNELVWEGGPVPEPWGDRWLKYEDEAKRLIALVRENTSPGLSEAETVSPPAGDAIPQASTEVQGEAVARQIAAALRPHGLTLMLAATGYEVARLGELKAEGEWAGKGLIYGPQPGQERIIPQPRWYTGEQES